VLSDPFQGFDKKDRLLLQDVAMAFEISITKARDMNDLEKVFWQTLREITKYRRV
jgi:predicted DNA-binding ribbon-helix-helix protein